MRAVTNSSDIMHVFRSEMSEYKIVSVCVCVYIYILSFSRKGKYLSKQLIILSSVWARGYF